MSVSNPDNARAVDDLKTVNPCSPVNQKLKEVERSTPRCNDCHSDNRVYTPNCKGCNRRLVSIREVMKSEVAK
jgi:hypothetical protein